MPYLNPYYVSNSSVVELCLYLILTYKSKKWINLCESLKERVYMHFLLTWLEIMWNISIEIQLLFIRLHRTSPKPWDRWISIFTWCISVATLLKMVLAGCRNILLFSVNFFMVFKVAFVLFSVQCAVHWLSAFVIQWRCRIWIWVRAVDCFKHFYERPFVLNRDMVLFKVWF